MTGISDEQIIREAVRLVDEGLAVTMLVKGRSMLPFILGGQESAVLTQPGDIRPGDQIMVLPRVESKSMQSIKDISQVIMQVVVSARLLLGVPSL